MPIESFTQLLAPRVLSGSYEQLPSLRRAYFTEQFYNASVPEDVPTDEYEIYYVPSENRPAPANVPGGQARMLTPGGAEIKNANLFRIFNKTTCPGNVLNALREPNSMALQTKGRETLLQIQRQFRTRHDLFREVCFSLIMSMGRVNLDANGNPLSPTVHATTGALTDHADTVISADFGVDNTHRGDLNSLISGQWSDASTKILDDIVALDDAAEAAGVPEIKHIWTHKINKKHLVNNTQVKEWAQSHDTTAGSVLRGDVIEDLWGKTWHFFGGKYQGPSDAGNDTDLLNNTLAIFTPELGGWLKAARGSELTPKRLSLTPGAEGALDNLEKSYGRFSYAKLEHDPVQVMMYMGENFGLNFADANAIYQGKCFTN